VKIFQIKKPENEAEGSFLQELGVAAIDFAKDVVVIFALVFLVIRPFFVAPFQVQQQSMEPNVHDGEYILVAKLPYKLGKQYETGDIVVFRPPHDPDGTHLIKRVIGTGGDTLKFEGGAVWVKQPGNEEFEKMADDTLLESNRGNTCLHSAGTCPDSEKAESYEIKIPEGKYFVIGDNRLNSRDSRSCFIGRCSDEGDHFITRENIEGTAWTVFFPLSGIRLF